MRFSSSMCDLEYPAFFFIEIPQHGSQQSLNAFLVLVSIPAKLHYAASYSNTDMFICTCSNHLMYIPSLSFISVLAPDWFVSFMHKYFNMGLLDADVSNYFDSLTESLIEERKSSDGSDFLQTLANNLAEAPSSDPDTSINHLGKAWTKKGILM